MPTPHNKYVAGSAPAARALRPTWPSSVSGSGARWRVFSNRLLVAERWWATSATSERYLTWRFGLERRRSPPWPLGDIVIRLIGPGGAGKTRTGSLLAEHLEVAFVDLDERFSRR